MQKSSRPKHEHEHRATLLRTGYPNRCLDLGSRPKPDLAYFKNHCLEHRRLSDLGTAIVATRHQFRSFAKIELDAPFGAIAVSPQPTPPRYGIVLVETGPRETVICSRPGAQAPIHLAQDATELKFPGEIVFNSNMRRNLHIEVIGIPAFHRNDAPPAGIDFLDA
jgi:hypothetical protein